MLEIDETMTGGEVEVGLGDSFEVRLAENPTTGHRWRLHVAGEPVVDVEEDSFQRSGAAHGAGGVRLWRFRTVQVGVANLELAYRRGWEENAAKTFRIAVRVSESARH